VVRSPSPQADFSEFIAGSLAFGDELGGSVVAGVEFVRFRAGEVRDPCLNERSRVTLCGDVLWSEELGASKVGPSEPGGRSAANTRDGCSSECAGTLKSPSPDGLICMI
jgi:hypothetical protein